MQQQQQQQQQPTQVVEVASVLQVLNGALSIDPAIRVQAEQMLRMWEGDAAPGFVSSLLRIVEQCGTVDEVRGNGIIHHFKPCFRICSAGTFMP